jgi:Tol biopolymer transport system component
MRRIPLFIGSICLLFLISLSCHNNPTGPVQRLPINPNIKRITFDGDLSIALVLHSNDYFPVFDKTGGYAYYIRFTQAPNQYNGIWKVDTSGREDAYQARQSDSEKVPGIFSYLEISHDGQWLVAVEGSSILQAGELVLFDTYSFTEHDISDSIMLYAFSAVFTPDNEHIIFMGTDNPPTGKNLGFYLYDMQTGKDSLIGGFDSAQPYGYDVSPDGKSLIYGIYGYNNGHHIGYRIFDLQTGTIDSSSTIYGEWFRYSPDGSRVLFSDNSEPFYGPSDTVGVITLATKQVTVLNVNADGDPINFNYTPYLNWMRDGRGIIYCQAPLMYDGGYQEISDLYILRSF